MSPNKMVAELTIQDYDRFVFDHCMYFNTTALARRLDREWTVAFQPFDLTPPQGFMLRAVLERPGLQPRELADLLEIARPTATRTLDGLAAKRLIERHAVAHDGREIAIQPTSRARALQPLLNDASRAVTVRLKKLLGAEAFASTVERVKGVRVALE